RAAVPPGCAACIAPAGPETPRARGPGMSPQHAFATHCTWPATPAQDLAPCLLAERGGFEPPSPRKEANGFRDRPVQPLRHLSGAGFTGLTRSPQIAGPVFGPVSSLHSPHFLLDEGLRETTVALRGHHRRVTEQLL